MCDRVRVYIMTVYILWYQQFQVISIFTVVEVVLLAGSKSLQFEVHLLVVLFQSLSVSCCVLLLQAKINQATVN